MGVLLQAAYRRHIKVNARTFLVSVPAPSDDHTPDVDWWYDHLAKQAHEFANVGLYMNLNHEQYTSNNIFQRAVYHTASGHQVMGKLLTLVWKIMTN